MKQFFGLFVALTLFLFLGCLAIEQTPRQDIQPLTPRRACFESDACFEVEVVSSPSAHAKGLMDRKALNPTAGMWFVFENEAPRSFWMKNMHFSLDIVWINKEKKIIGISESVAPCAPDLCASIASPGPVQYVLEIPAGAARRSKAQIGQTVTVS